jgi:glycosyltransferase involved in cell wall biosynthesis
MIHIAVPGKFQFGTGGVTTVIYRINTVIAKKIVYEYISYGKSVDKKYIDMIKNIGSNIISICNCRIPIIKNITILFVSYIILKNNKYSICYINSSASLSLLYWGFIAKIAGVPVIIGHSHSSRMDAVFGIRIIKTIFHYLCRPLLPLVITDYLTCSSKAAEWMYPKSIINSNKIVLINNPIDISKYSYNTEIRNNKRKEHGLEDKLIIGHVGRLVYQKNHSFLLKIFKEILKKQNHAVLFLIGAGLLKKKIEKEAYGLGIRENVIFFGTTSVVHEYMQMFDIFLLPSRFEGLPVVGIEAQCSGLPCIFSDNITTEVDITNNCLFLPLKISPKQWAEETIRYKESFVRKDCSDMIKLKGFDIQDSANQLEKVFIDSLHE